MASLFFSYSHADEVLRDQLEKQLSVLKRQGVIEVWHDRRIGAGQDFAAEIDRHIETDDIILLLVSSDFLASDYCYESEMKRAMDRHDAGEAIVIPVILRACDWRGAPFGKLNATPPDGKPITQYPDRDHALLEVAKAVRAAANRVEPRHSAPEPVPLHASSQARRASTPRSSNLRLAKEFTDRDRDRFKHESFDYIAKFFENSLEELERRNPGIETGFRRVDANRFTAAVYKNGRAISRCTVFIGGLGADGIAYLASESTESNAMNESLSIRSDEHDLYLKSLGMQRSTESHLSQEGAAEYYWSMLIERLQGK
ncbi:toll/interleukin-1 receptor domain-containing protein [Bradyrhizobium monzae]|uniref:toll/interleukin-1 receptor domain-containing protein n=1 Tax=Bradyrhizobium sp. Oc8 TaxID=2876780 RepID=UPI001F1F0116|nr:toll/interleukin-1 receptor domain-containing protein [Bradyrhizobium sp. Oc8]